MVKALDEQHSDTVRVEASQMDAQAHATLQACIHAHSTTKMPVLDASIQLWQAMRSTLLKVISKLV